MATTLKAALIIALIVLVSVLEAMDAVAEGSVYGGLDVPSEGGSDFGWALGGYYTVPVSPVFEVGGTVAYNKFISVLAGLPALGELFDYNFRPWEIQALGQVNFVQADSRALRGFAGLGVASYSRIGEGGESGRKTKFAWQSGLAARIEMVEFRLGYHWIDLGDMSAKWFGLTLGAVF